MTTKTMTTKTMTTKTMTTKTMATKTMTTKTMTTKTTMTRAKPTASSGHGAALPVSTDGGGHTWEWAPTATSSATNGPDGAHYSYRSAPGLRPVPAPTVPVLLVAAAY